MTLLSEAVFAVIDTETTGTDPAKDRACEIGCVLTSLAQPNLGMWATLVNPGIPIPPESSAVHGITDADVAGAPNLDAALGGLARFLNTFEDAGCGRITPIAFNAAFDSVFVPLAGRENEWLCAMRLAKHLWPDAPNFKNQTLRYWRGHRIETYGIASHRALGDCSVTAATLRDELTLASFIQGFEDVRDVVSFANAPIRIEKMPFGKYYDKPIATAAIQDAQYLEWCLSERGPDRVKNDADLRWSIEQALRAARDAE